MSRGIAGLQKQPSQRGGLGPPDAQDDEEAESEPPDLSSGSRSLPSREHPNRLTVTSGRPETQEENKKRGYDVVSSERQGVRSPSQVSGASEQDADQAQARRQRQGHQSLSETNSGRRDRGRRSKAASCTNCRARKVRCDKAKPCSQCVLRGIGHTCSAPPLIESSTAVSQEHYGAAPSSIQEAPRPRRLSAPFTSVRQQPSRISASPGTITSAAVSHRGIPTTPSRPPQTTPQASRMSIESRLASLERKFDRLSVMVERLTTGRSSHGQSVLTSVQRSEPSSSRHGSTVAGVYAPALPQENYSGRLPFQTIHELHQQQQQQQSQQQMRSSQMSLANTSSRFAARQTPVPYEPADSPSLQSSELTMEPQITTEARQSPYRAYRQTPSSPYNTASILERRSDEMALGSNEASEDHSALREHESLSASALLTSSLNDGWGHTSNLATLSLDEGVGTAQDTSTSSFS